MLAPGVHSELVTFAGQRSLHYMGGCCQPLTIRVLKIFLIFVTVVIAIQRLSTEPRVIMQSNVLSVNKYKELL